MKKLTIIALLVTLLFTSCEKISNYEQFIGQWVPEQDGNLPMINNFIYYGYFTDSVRSTRIIAQYNSLKIVIFDAPKIIVGGIIRNKMLFYDDFYLVNHPSNQNCSKDSIVFYNIVGEVKDDTLIETGNYTVYVNGVESDRYVNEYVCKFVKRK